MLIWLPFQHKQRFSETIKGTIKQNRNNTRRRGHLINQFFSNMAKDLIVIRTLKKAITGTKQARNYTNYTLQKEIIRIELLKTG